jgi:glycosyl hydrolase family 99
MQCILMRGVGLRNRASAQELRTDSQNHQGWLKLCARVQQTIALRFRALPGNCLPGLPTGLSVLAILLGICNSQCADTKPLLVHYLPWFVAKPFSPNWGWHWTMNHYSPDHTNGAGRREIASWYYPEIGPYDSSDPVVLEYHVLLMKLAGIDGVIADWYGKDDFNDYAIIEQRTAALLRFATRARLKFCLCYEDRSIQAAVNAGRLPASEAIACAQQAMLYAQGHYFNNPAYLRQISQKPVLLNFGPVYFTQNEQWVSIFSVLSPTNRPSFFSTDRRLPVGAGAFNWPPMHLSPIAGGTLSSAALTRYLSTFEEDGRAWPAFISSSFPRFHDIYSQAGIGSSYGFLDDDGGATFRSSLSRAMTNTSCLVQLATWNDFGEGTVLEPTVEHGYRDLAVIQDFRRRYLEPAFPFESNDLNLATRLYTLRRQCGSDAGVSAELDRVFEAAVTGKCKTADRELRRIEAAHRHR